MVHNSLAGVGRAHPSPFLSLVFPRLLAKARGGCTSLTADPHPRHLLRGPCGFSGYSYPFRAPCVALSAPRPAPTHACAVFRTRLRLWCACAAFPAAPTLRLASPARGGPGRGRETPPSCPEGRGSFSSPARLLPGLPTKDSWGCRGGARAPPLFPPARGSLFGNFLSTSGPTRAVELQALDPPERPLWA